MSFKRINWLLLLLVWAPFGVGAEGAGSVGHLKIKQNENQSISQLGSIFGPPCQTRDSNDWCIALKYVVYQDVNLVPVTSEVDLTNDIKGINRLWNQCKIQFEIEQYQVVQPGLNDLQFNPANDVELTDIRKTYSDSDRNRLLIVDTGAWNRAGTLGYTSANAWTSMPGDVPYGVVLEQPVGNFSNIIAHELGHYLGLFHVGDASNLMNPVIYSESAGLSLDQCETARSIVATYWQKMTR